MSKISYMILFIVCLSCPAVAADKITLMLNWYIYAEHVPFFYGKEKGFYSDVGIDLNIQEGRGSSTVTQVVAANSVQFAYVDVPTMMRAAVKGAPVIAIGVALKTTPMSAMGFADKGIRAPADMKGRKIITGPGDSLTQIWPLFLKKTGLRESDFTMLFGDANMKLNSVINGQADLLLGSVMDQSMKIKEVTGRDVYAIKWADYGVDLIGSGVVANTAFAKANPDLVRRFMAATTRSFELASQDSRGAAQSVLNANPKAGKIDSLTQGFELTIPLYKDPNDQSSRHLRISEQKINEAVNVMVEYGGLEAAAKEFVGKFYTNEYLPE